MRVIVVGTGTEIGKTHVACALLRAWRDRGRDVVGLKPVETGLGAEALSQLGHPPEAGGVELAGGLWGEPGSDQRRLLSAVETDGEMLHVKQDLLSRMTDDSHLSSSFHVKRPRPLHSLYAFSDPVSPHLAAQRADVRIDLGAIHRWIVLHEREVTLVETAGGLFSPLDDFSTTNFDLVSALLPARLLLVAPDRLGVLHDLTATLGLAKARGRTPDAVILSAIQHADHSTGLNAPSLRSLGIADPVSSFPRAPYDSPSSQAAARHVVDWLDRPPQPVPRA